MKSITERSIRTKLLKSGFTENDIGIIYRILSDMKMVERVLKN